MKIRSLLVVAGLAISLAVPIFAQQTNTPDPKLREQLVALLKKFDEAYNNNDAAAFGALFTEDAVFVTDRGPIYGRQAIEKHQAELYNNVRFSDHIATPDQKSPRMIGTAGNEMWATGEYSLTYQVKGGDPAQQKGYWGDIFARDGDSWKARMITWNVTPPPTEPVKTK